MFWILAILVWLIVGFIVCSLVLEKPDGFSWDKYLNPFSGSWWSKEDVHIQGAKLLAPVWPLVLFAAIFAKTVARSTTTPSQDDDNPT